MMRPEDATPVTPEAANGAAGPAAREPEAQPPTASGEAEPAVAPLRRHRRRSVPGPGTDGEAGGAAPASDAEPTAPAPEAPGADQRPRTAESEPAVRVRPEPAPDVQPEPKPEAPSAPEAPVVAELPEPEAPRATEPPEPAALPKADGAHQPGPEPEARPLALPKAAEAPLFAPPLADVAAAEQEASAGGSPFAPHRDAQPDVDAGDESIDAESLPDLEVPAFAPPMSADAARALPGFEDGVGGEGVTTSDPFAEELRGEPQHRYDALLPGFEHPAAPVSGAAPSLAASELGAPAPSGANSPDGPLPGFGADPAPARHGRGARAVDRDEELAAELGFGSPHSEASVPGGGAGTAEALSNAGDPASPQPADVHQPGGALQPPPAPRRSPDAPVSKREPEPLAPTPSAPAPAQPPAVPASPGAESAPLAPAPSGTAPGSNTDQGSDGVQAPADAATAPAPTAPGRRLAVWAWIAIAVAAALLVVAAIVLLPLLFRGSGAATGKVALSADARLGAVGVEAVDAGGWTPVTDASMFVSTDGCTLIPSQSGTISEDAPDGDATQVELDSLALGSAEVTAGAPVWLSTGDGSSYEFATAQVVKDSTTTGLALRADGANGIVTTLQVTCSGPVDQVLADLASTVRLYAR